MAEHGDLVAEIMSVEKMGTLERLRHAKKRRVHQLKKFTQYEKQLDKASRRRKGGSGGGAKGRRAAAGNVHFVGDVMLLEAAARNDLDEGQCPGGGSATCNFSFSRHPFTIGVV